eukprot:gene17136-8666_t
MFVKTLIFGPVQIADFNFLNKNTFLFTVPVNINATSSYMISVPATTKSQTLWTNSIYSASPSIKPSPKPTSKSPNTTQKPHQPAKSGRRFDAASFIGGMLLCGGLILLVYIAVRCFRSRPDYHKL